MSSLFTIFSNAQCYYSIVLTDDFGDGWNGGQVEISVAGLSVGNYSIINGTGPDTNYFSVQTGDEVRATYTAGQWPTENEYHIYDADGVEIFSDGVSGSIPTANDTLVGTGNCPTCPIPVSLTASNITQTTADLSWIETGSAAEWEVEYGLQGYIQGSGTLVSGLSNTSCNLSGLSSGTSSDFYVRSVCGSGDTSLWAGPVSFTTECVVTTAPFFENFENSGIIPNCWRTYSNSTVETWKFNTPNNNDHTAPFDHTTGLGYFAWIDDSENPPTSDIILQSPLIDVSVLSIPTLYFWRYSDDEGSGVSATLYVDIWDGSLWHNHVATFTGNSSGWHKETVDLASLTISGPIQIRFIVDEVNGNYFDDIAIDDIEIINLETCQGPDSLVVNEVGITTADISWVESGSASTWNIQYGFAGFSLGTGDLVYGVSDTSFTLTGLNQLTEYDAYVQSKCSGTDSSWWAGPLQFMTGSGNPTNCEMGIDIPDGDCIEIPLTVSGNFNQLGNNVELQEVHLIIQHPYDADIVVSLESPTGIIDTLTRQNGANGDNYGIIDGTCSQYTNFTMSASTPISGGTSPFAGDYIPEGDFSIFNDGSDPNGTWILHICDVWPQDAGTFEFAQLVFNNILPPAIMKINEIDVDQGSQDTAEFVEIYDGGYGNYPLDDFCLVFYDGAGDTIYATYDLDGYSTNPNGYFILGDSLVANVQMFLQDSIQDGTDAIALYLDTAVNHPVGSGVSLTNIQDAVVYSTDDPFDLQLLQLLNSGQPQINENILGRSDIHALARLPNGTGSQQNTSTYYVAIPTPGDSNIAIPQIQWADSTFFEDWANDGSITNAITINLKNDIFAHSGVFTDGIEFISGNLPVGFTAQVNILSDTTATINLLGNAVAHMDSNDVNNLKILFTNQAFTFGDTLYCKNFFNDSLRINFMDVPPPQMLWDTTVFFEDSLIHGGIENVIHLHLIMATFSVDSGFLSDSVFFTTANVPQGLQVQIEINDSVNATVSLLGNAILNADSNDINNLTISFLDTAFLNHFANEVINSSNDSLRIDFNDGLSNLTEILSFSFTLETSAANINHVSHTVDIEVNEYADLSYMVPVFLLSSGATATISGIPQISGTTPNDYTNPIIYNILAEDTVTNQDWIITVTQANTIEEEEIEGLEIYPNPTDDNLNIISRKEQISEIQLNSVTGETILQYDASNKQTGFVLSLKSIPSGIYYLKLKIKDKVLYKKIVITK